MKREIPPAAFAAAIAVVAVIIGLFIFRQVNAAPPTPRPDASQYTGGKSSSPSVPAPNK